MTGRVKVGVAIAAPTLALLALGTTLWLNRPFQVELAYYRTSLADRTEAQRHNIHQAAKALDGIVIEPGETFSFNQVVGPRTPERGYREAPAFMERDLVKSIGGGVCQVSSTVYNAAALVGFTMIERHAHSRLVASVPPGRDATVWYGMTDLKFRNSQMNSTQISARISNDMLIIAVLGRMPGSDNVFIHTKSLVSPLLVKRFQTVRITKVDNTSFKQEVLSVDMYKQ